MNELFVWMRWVVVFEKIFPVRN